MLRGILAIWLVTFASAAAIAGEIGNTPAASSYRWDGYYVGGHIGGAWGDQDATIVPDIFILPPRSRIPQDQDGVVYGAQGGFNYQTGAWVTGIEGTFSGTSLDGAGHRDSLVPDFTVYTSGDINWLASIVGRFGYAHDRTLLYVKGGVAWLDFDFEGHSEFSGTYAGGGKVDDRRTGWTLGVGVEYALSPNWSTRLEYSYFDFGSEDYTINLTPIEIDMALHSLQLGLNYRF